MKPSAFIGKRETGKALPSRRQRGSGSTLQGVVGHLQDQHVRRLHGYVDQPELVISLFIGAVRATANFQRDNPWNCSKSLLSKRPTDFPMCPKDINVGDYMATPSALPFISKARSILIPAGFVIFLK